MSFRARSGDYPVGSSIRQQIEAAESRTAQVLEKRDALIAAVQMGSSINEAREVLERAVSRPMPADLALGRLRHGEMNRTEAAYAETLEQRLQALEIRWYRFEAVKLRLAANTFYTPDFIVLAGDGLLEFHEVKGRWHDDARVKIKVAASLYPFRFLAVQKVRKKDGGGWKIEAF